MVSEHQLQQIVDIGGSEGVSAGLRSVVSAGLLAPVSELHQLADKLAKIQGRRTTAGGWWAPTEDALPEPGELDPAGSVLVTPAAVGLLGDGALSIDLAAGEIAGRVSGHEITVAMAGPGRRDLGHGLTARMLEVEVEA